MISDDVKTDEKLQDIKNLVQLYLVTFYKKAPLRLEIQCKTGTHLSKFYLVFDPA